MIVDACLAIDPKIVAVILYGSFGRDEGSWYRDEQGNWQPYNDYDVQLVSDRPISQAALTSRADALARSIGIRWIDLGHLRPGALGRMRPSILNYDFKNGSKVVFGDSSILDRIPDFDASDLTMKEGLILYFTRLYTFLGSLDERGLESAVSGERSRFFRNQMAKAVLATVDVLLLSKAAYHSSYRTRVKRVGQLYPAKAGLLELSQWALEEKLSPRATQMSPEDVRALYARVRDHYIREMHAALSLHFGRAVAGPGDIERFTRTLPRSVARRVYRVVRSRSLAPERELSVMLAQSYLLAAWGERRINDAFLERGVALLRRVDRTLPASMTWDQARLQAVRLRMEP